MSTQQKHRAVIYCRVSTKEQVEEGNSLATQERVCREYALKNSYEIAAVFIEQGESAKTIDRTELKKLMKFCSAKKNEVSAVIAYKIDRISRNTDDYSQIRIQFKRYGVDIKYTSESFENTPAGRFMENIIANVAQFDNDVRAERSIGGMKDAVRQGRYVWQAPFGYSNVRIEGKATIAPNSFAPIVRKTFETIALNQHPLEEVRRDILKDGLTVHNGNPLSKSYFYRLIKNELYSGWINKFGERHKGTFDPIISEELYNKVKVLLSLKGRSSQQHSIPNPDFPLRRFLRHPSGRLLTGAWSTGRKKKYPYYMIHQTGINIRKECLENAFAGWLNYFKMDINHFENLYSFIKQDLKFAMLENGGKRDRLENRKRELKIKQSSIVNKNIDGVINDELCKEKLAEINSELYDINSAILNIPATEIDQEEILHLVREVMMQPGDLWRKLDLEGRMKLQWFYFPKGIEIDKNGSRTTEICRLFKLKTMISPYQSSKVNHRNSKSNTNILQLSLPSLKKLDIQSPEFWEEIQDEVKVLRDILNPKDDLFFPQNTHPK